MKITMKHSSYSLKSDSHVPEYFCQIKIFPSLVQKNTIICLVFEIENKWILKLQILFSWKTGWFVLTITYNMLTQKYYFC